MVRRGVLLALALSVLVLHSFDARADSAEEALLMVGVTGSVASEGKQNPTYLMRPRAVQRLLLDIADEPRDRAYATRALEGSGISLDDLLALRLLRESGNRLVINFNFLTQRDQAEIVRIAARHAAVLANGFLARRDEIEAVLARRRLLDVPAADYAYILIGCFSLDWDGLTFTVDPRYRSSATHRIGRDVYTPWAKEKGDAVSLKGLYWGSHNQSMENANLTTFGDHHSLPRAGFPDLGWSLRVDTDRLPGDEATRRRLVRAARQFLRELPGAVADLMMALGDGPQSVDALAAATSLSPETISETLGLLAEIEYVAEHGPGYRATIPVLTDADTPMVQELLSLGRGIIREWHERHYDELAADLSHITPLKHGVPYGVVYTEIWHFVFALANRKLVEAGLMADPYDEQRRYKGFIPAVWSPGQDRLDGGDEPTEEPPS
jgi:hypothetical protein